MEKNSKLAKHFLDNRHSIGSMENIMKILHINRKENILNIL